MFSSLSKFSMRCAHLGLQGCPYHNNSLGCFCGPYPGYVSQWNLLHVKFSKSGLSSHKWNLTWVLYNKTLAKPVLYWIQVRHWDYCSLQSTNRWIMAVFMNSRGDKNSTVEIHQLLGVICGWNISTVKIKAESVVHGTFWAQWYWACHQGLVLLQGAHP